MLVLDLETRSPVPIKSGARKYAEQAEIICMSFAFNAGPVRTWRALEGEPFPAEVHNYIRSGKDVGVHNAEFECAIFEAVLPKHCPERHQWVCSASLAAACGLPRGLAFLARCLGLPQQKQADGRMLIQECSIPPYNEDPALFAKMYKYCEQDVEVTRNVFACLRDFTVDEHEDHQVNLIINARGIPVDLWLAEHAQNYAVAEIEDMRAQIEWASRGDLTKKGGSKLTAWVYERLSPELQEHMHRYKDGEKHIVFDRAVRAELIDAQANIDADTYRVIECADMASRSSVSKYKAMLHRAQDDGRVRGCYQMNGAAQTGRYSSTGLQMHNFPRASHPDTERILDVIESGQDLDNCMETLSQMLRCAVRAETGHTLVWGDWSAIEGRVLPWLAASALSDAKLDLYRQGQDVYVHTAAAMMNCSIDQIDDDLRQTGKVAELALGFAGGAGALHSMGRNYGRTFTDAAAEQVKNQWRASNRWAVNFWNDLEVAAKTAFLNPGTLHHAGRVAYIHLPEVLMGSLWCRLPSGRMICYPGVRYTLEPTPWGEAYQLSAIKGTQRPKATEKDWPRAKLWKGLLAENIAQAVAADILRSTLRSAVLDLDWPVIGHTHDEIVMEVTNRSVTEAQKDLKWLMERAPAWADGLPLAVKMGSGERYGK